MPMLDVACVALVAGAIGSVVLPGVRSGLRVPAVVLCVATLCWIVTAMLRSAHAAEDPRILGVMFLAVGITAASGFVLVSRLVDYRARTPGWLLALMVVVPLFSAVGTWQKWGLGDFEEFRSGPVFFVHAVFSFGFLAAMVLRLSQRQWDPSPRVRAYVSITQVLVIVLIVLEVATSPDTHVVVSVIVAFSAWMARHSDEWRQASANADELLDSIGVFLLVFDQSGRLRNWNSSAAQLIVVIRPGITVSQGMWSQELLGLSPPFQDGTVHEFPLSGGVLRTLCHTHRVDAPEGAGGLDWVVMFRPLRPRMQAASPSVPSGELAGHDPHTQTLSRRATLAQLAHAEAAVRIDLTPHDDSVAIDEVMFVVARRLEAWFGQVSWGRVTAWSFAGATTVSDAEALARALADGTRQPLVHGLSARCEWAVLRPDPDEPGASFALRAGRPGARRSSSGGRNRRR